MKNSRIKSKIITGVLLASMVLSGATAVFAADLTSTSDNTAITQNKGRNQDGNRFKTKLDNLFTAGVITSDQKTAIEGVLTPQGMNKDVNQGKGKNSEDRQNMFKTKLDTLVTSGTITADQETAVLKALTSKEN
jgi:hypothetical protein